MTTVVGAETLARLRGEAFRRYVCASCGGPGRADAEPTTVIALQYRLGPVKVRFAHARCADSRVAQARAGTVDVAASGRMLARAAILQYASGPPVRPLLILEPQIEVAVRSAGDETQNVLLTGLLDRGFTLLRSAGQFPGPAEGWLLQASDTGARLLCPDGIAAYDGGAAWPAGWLDLARWGNACVVLAAAVGLGTYIGEQLAIADLRRLLGQAARAGELAGALVQVQRS